ncbi:MAG: haloacid dehalogenase-like hydrolase [Gemmatimonadetes bacterium]|jgi:phosphoglycolate phosphatase|nr:haloacid dehalogenase-like hydrolase [Gemmatimonadota bacterium]
MKIALFDIDGTILLAHGAGRRSMERALVAGAGAVGSGGQHYAGKTDPQIAREAMRYAGLNDAEIDARMAGVIELYLANLDAELHASAHDPPRVLPGVREILDACEAHEGVVLGLLTGNVMVGAERKLRAVGVDPGRFEVGAFGSDHEDRPTLAEIARQRAADYLARDVAGNACVVIGDTPADVACGLAIGARTIAVCTGNFSDAELRASGAHVVMRDLSDTPAVLQAILNG